MADMPSFPQENKKEYRHLDEFNLREVAPDIFRLDILYPSPGRTCCYLLINDNAAALVDCGASRGVDVVMTVLKEKEIAPEGVEWLLMTHPHLDHAGGAGRLMQLLPKAMLAAHPSTIKHLVDPYAALVPGVKSLYGEEFYNAHYEKVEPVQAKRVHPLTDGEHLLLGEGRALRTVYSPGHAWNHVCFYDEQSSFLFCGDAYGVSYPALNSAIGGTLLIPTTSPTQLDVAAMEKTIQMLHDLKPKQFGLTHFGAFTAAEGLTEQLLAAMREWPIMAEKLYDENPADFQERLSSYFLDWMMARSGGKNAELLRKHQSPDAVLNAYGFEHWLQKRKAAADSAS